MALIICGFPGVGKSFAFTESFQRENSLKILDSDSSLYSWLWEDDASKSVDDKGQNIRNPDFPENYIHHLTENMNYADIIFVASHSVVRNALKAHNIPFIQVYPYKELKDEYISRYKARKSDDRFIDTLSKNWDSFIESLENEKDVIHVRLKEAEFLSDILPQIIITQSE